MESINMFDKLPFEINWKKLLFLTGLFFVIIISLRIFIFTLTPFFLALVLATMIDRPVKLIERKLPRIVAVLITLFIILLIILLITIFIFTNIISELIQLTRYLPEYREHIENYVRQGIVLYEDFFEPVPEQFSEVITNNLIIEGEKILSSTVSNLIEGTIVFIDNIPAFIILILFMVITSFFLSKDKEKILNYLKTRTKISDSLQSNIVKDVLTYLKVQLMIMTNTTILTGITFHFINVPYAIMLALCCGVLDLIPVVGPGAILWPMILYYLLTLNYSSAIILFILYLIVITVRPILESKVLGRNIGVHPLILLFGLYVGLVTLGVQGVILAPLSLIIFKSFINNGFS